jgi:class 3 adenylate cyclase
MTDPISVTLLPTDIEGRTRLWREDEASIRRALARHDRLLRSVLTEHGGTVFSTMGDGPAAAFVIASAARTYRAADHPGCR